MISNLRRAALFAAFAFIAAFSHPAAAETPGVPSWISEGKIGLLTHDSYMFEDNFLQIWKNRKEPGMDANFELLFNLPDFFRHIGSPRLAVGADLSTNGPGTDYAYIAPDWQYNFDSGIYLGGFFGFMVHNGKLDIAQDDNGVITPDSQRRFDETKRLGSRVLFHFGPRLGYNIDEHNDIEVMWAHSSNGHILAADGEPNQGIDNVGVRYGYKF